MPEISTTVSSRVYYKKVGVGPVLILLHGFPESSAVWQNISGDLSASYTLIMPDFPGSGNSVLETETGIGEMADCINAIMEHEQINKAVIAGHSMGGYVGFEFASRYPVKVAGLSLIHSTPAADDDEKKRTRHKSIEIIRKGGKNAFINQMVPNLFSAGFKQSNFHVVKNQVEAALGMEDKSLINFYRAMLVRKDHTDMLRSASFPMQWIAGIDDNILYYKKILESCHVSNVNFVSLYPDCGHMSMFEAPGNLVHDLREFINYSYNFTSMD